MTENAPFHRSRTQSEFLEKLRATAQPEHGVVRDRGRAWRVDVDYPDQHAIPPAMLDEIEAAIIPGSGRVTPRQP
jgi:hypothetical protein